MVHAFIMMKTEAGESENLLSDVRTVDRVTEAHVVAGDYDIIAEVDAEEVYDALQTVTGELSRLGGVADTKTYVALE